MTRLFYSWGDEVRVRRHRISSTDGHALTLLEVAPKNIEPFSPALMYYHGGGFFLTYGRGHLNSVKRYALQSNCTVFMPEYRRSTRHAFPAPFDDCFAALQWVFNNAKKLTIDSSRIAVGGDSAGGCLAAAVAQKATDQANAASSDLKLVGQLLIYPVTDYETKTESALAFTDTPVWTTESNRIMWELYLKNSFNGVEQEPGHSNVPPYAAPIHRGGFKGLPKAYVEVAEFDPLRDEAINYAKELTSADVPVQLEQVGGAVHGYDMINCEISRQYQALRVAALNKFFNI